MKELWRLFWLVRYVKSDAYQHASIHQQQVDRIIGNLEALYIAKTGKDEAWVKELVRVACQETPAYIEQEERGPRILVFRVAKQGRKLTSFPLGTLECISNELGRGLSLFIAISIAVIPNIGRIWHIIHHK